VSAWSVLSATAAVCLDCTCQCQAHCLGAQRRPLRPLFCSSLAGCRSFSLSTAYGVQAARADYYMGSLSPCHMQQLLAAPPALLGCAVPCLAGVCCAVPCLLVPSAWPLPPYDLSPASLPPPAARPEYSTWAGMIVTHYGRLGTSDEGAAPSDSPYAHFSQTRAMQRLRGYYSTGPSRSQSPQYGSGAWHGAMCGAGRVLR